MRSLISINNKPRLLQPFNHVIMLIELHYSYLDILSWQGGIDGRQEATGLGVFFCLREFLNDEVKKKLYYELFSCSP